MKHCHSAPIQTSPLAEAILALHKPWYEVNGVRHAHRVLVAREDVPKDHVCHIGGLDACSPEDHYVDACNECRWTIEDCDPASPLWPCPTARLAQKALINYCSGGVA